MSASNLDKTRTRIVRKGVTADYSGLRVRVQKVRLGVAYCETLISHQSLVMACKTLTVVA